MQCREDIERLRSPRIIPDLNTGAFWNPLEQDTYVTEEKSLRPPVPPTYKDSSTSTTESPLQGFEDPWGATLKLPEQLPPRSNTAKRTEILLKSENPPLTPPPVANWKRIGGKRLGTLLRRTKSTRSTTTSESETTPPSKESQKITWSSPKRSPLHVESGFMVSPESGRLIRYTRGSRTITQKTHLNGGTVTRTKTLLSLTTWIPTSESGQADSLKSGEINTHLSAMLKEDPFLFDPTKSSLPASTPLMSVSPDSNKLSTLSLDGSN